MIPDEAVGAAVVAWVGRQVWQDCDEAWKADYMERTRIALEAAAPHIIREAKADAWDEFQRGQWSTNPYRSQT